MKLLADLKRLLAPPAHGGPLLALLAVLLPAGLRAAAPGTLDTTYQNPETDSPAQVVVAQKDASGVTVTEVKRIAVLPTGGVLTITHFSEGDADRLIQLADTDGSVPNTPLFYSTITGGRVYDMNVDGGGRVVIVGNFDTVDSTSRESHVARFSAAGVIDANFVGGEPLPSVLLQSVVVDATGQPLVGGVSFFTPALFRLTADTGAVDPTFSFPLGEQTSYVQSLALQPDGALLAAGQFQIGQTAANLVRVVTGVGGTAPTSNNVNVTVPGTSNLWLAGAAAGTTASTGQDTLANATPFQVAGLTITPGNALTFIATGTVSNDPAVPNTSGPDGTGTTNHTVENGISSLTAPLDSLVGVFLDDSTPTGTPPAGYDFSAGTSPAGGVNFTSFTPALRQPFFIGNGKNAAGGAQSIVVPAGATRLFLGSLDPSDQENNLGVFQVAITSGTATPPAAGPILVINPDDFTYAVKGQPNTGTVVPGDKITFSLVVRNTGTAPATNVAVTATYDPTNTKLVQDGISPDGFPIQNIINWTVPKINNGDHVTLTYTVKVKAGVNAQAGLSIGSQVESATAAA